MLKKESVWLIMKIAKSSKIIFLLATFVLSLVLAFSFSVTGTSAAEITVSDYFGGTASAEIKEDKLSVSVKDGDTFSVKNKLAIDDFETSFTVGEGVTKITVNLTADSYFGAGVLENADGEVSTEIKNVIVLDYVSGNFTLNGAKKETDIKNKALKLDVDKDGLLSVEINGEKLTVSDDMHKIGGKDKTAAAIEFVFETSGSEAVVAFDYFDQGASVADGSYKQSFDSAKLTEKAYPRVALKDSFGATSGNNVNLLNGKEYSVSFTSYSLLGWSDSFCLAKESDNDNVWLSNETYPDDIAVSANSMFTVKSASKTIETYNVTVYNKADDTTAPVYNYSEVALNAYKSALVKATLKEYTVTENGEEKTVEKHVKLGDKITVPSFRGLVFDDNTSYDNLTHTMYYKTPSSDSGSTDGWTITLSDVGTYQFYVVFKDEADNAMEKDDFYKENDDGSITTDGKYYGYVFSFTVEDDAPIYVYAAKSQASGFLNTEYTFTEFTVEASGYTPSYKLYFCATKDGEYKEITAASNLPSSEENYTGEDFTYAEIKDFDYDGKLTFTPIKKGYYKVVCTVASTKTVRYDSAESQIVEISKKPTIVKPDNHWLENNVWSVVFLSIGTLCLIGIVVLLFIKPKDETDADNE